MKQIISVIVACALLAGCAKSKIIDGKEYQPYGLVTSDRKDPKIEYDVVWGNVIWGGALFETAIAPIYFFGFSLFEPIGLKPSQPELKGANT